VERGKCLVTFDVLTAGHVLKLLWLIASIHVDFTGLKHEACRKRKWSLMRCRTVDVLLAWLVCLKVWASVHRPLAVRLPRKTCFPLYVMMASLLSKVAVQPPSHNFPIEIRELWREGKMCALVVVVGSVSVMKGNWAV